MTTKEITSSDIEGILEKPMFCLQCEQTIQTTGCTRVGVCGKQPSSSAIQDLILQGVSVLSGIFLNLSEEQITDEWIRVWLRSAFTTLTNVNFDDEALHLVALKLQNVVKDAFALLPADAPRDKLQFVVSTDFATAIKSARPFRPDESIRRRGHSAGGMEQFIIQGLKGICAYADHVEHLEGLGAIRSALLSSARRIGRMHLEELELGELLGTALGIGEDNLTVIDALDRAHTATYGQPELTQVPTYHREGKCILVTGHDLKDLKSLLAAADAAGVTVYTHGEMIPAHSYPRLKEHSSLFGNYGTAWQNQQKEFPDFPGPMLFTTNCIQRPRPEYAERVFTTGRVGWPGCQHIKYGEWEPLIAAALAAPGFPAGPADGPKLLVGAHHKTVLSLADKVLGLIGEGKLKHVWLIGGCDGARPGRNYFSDLAMKIPDDHLILTGACGRFRINSIKDYGDIEGIPRLLDVGQCNDLYSAVRIAMGLADALGCTVNDLPLSLVVSFYEQKAIVQLLTLLHLGIMSVKVGPTLPRALSPAVVAVLAEKFGISVTDPKKVDEDLAAVVGK
eukprot:gnl/Dysnectes_brevis/92_a111_4111.p1 GENE.gnl/Dysnectes_brevis/92_a111_4111~~gnl/Dysnectes_brevis/92_a111_4111.p1  ORF type:complete len:563 (+),score=258.85 gnl/Dysnectes_brevis/92_a111_4111:1031-2719(+)